ncbi:hypothetical protein BDZ89DRAFT_1045691 [Hymenopellis radicata]|nr:hypothetical protein BDZ89DRAFT_1045691 [Hymenopellis radicata]
MALHQLHELHTKQIKPDPTSSNPTPDKVTTFDMVKMVALWATTRAHHALPLAVAGVGTEHGGCTCSALRESLDSQRLLGTIWRSSSDSIASSSLDMAGSRSHTRTGMLSSGRPATMS